MLNTVMTCGSVNHFYFLIYWKEDSKNKQTGMVSFLKRNYEGNALKNLSCWAGSHRAKFLPGLGSLDI